MNKPININLGDVIKTPHGDGVYVGYEKIDYRNRVYPTYENINDFDSPDRLIVKLVDQDAGLTNQPEYCLTLQDYLTYN